LCRDWAERAAHHFGLEVAPAEVAEDDLAAICEQSPLILPETNPEGMMTGFIVVLGTRFPLVSRREPTQVVILTPDGESACIAATELFTPNPTMGDCDALRAILSEAGVEARRRERACRLLRPLLGPEHGREIWRLIPRTAGRIGPAMLQAAGPALPLFIASQALATFLWLLSWWVIGAQTLAGRIDLGWAGAWVLCLLSLVPLQLLGLWAEGLASIRVGSFLRRRFLWGALELDPERIRHLGAGMLFGRIVEAQNFEGLALSGGFLTLSALIELVAAAVVLALGAGAGAHAFLLALFALAAAGLGVNHWHKRQQSADARLHLTHMLVERMVGHRTRLALLSPDRWPEEEDPELAHYARASAASDGTAGGELTCTPTGDGPRSGGRAAGCSARRHAIRIRRSHRLVSWPRECLRGRDRMAPRGHHAGFVTGWCGGRCIPGGAGDAACVLPERPASHWRHR
jgi:ATP-binding cassette subfamily B protein